MRLRAALVVSLLLATPPAATAAATVETPIHFTLDSGRAVEARLRHPPAKKPLPAVMIFGGFKGAARVLERVKTDEPLALASFDYPYDPPRKFRFPHSLAQGPELKRLVPDTVDGIVKLRAALAQHPAIDPARISIVGASLGAPFAVLAAAQADLPGVILLHGFGQSREVVAQQMRRKWQPRYGAFAEGPAWLLSWLAVFYVKPPVIEDHAVRLRAGQQVLLVTATEDSFIPKTASDSLWQALQRSQARVERVDRPGDHLRSGPDREQQLAELQTLALDWLKQRGLR